MLTQVSPSCKASDLQSLKLTFFTHFCLAFLLLIFAALLFQLSLPNFHVFITLLQTRAPEVQHRVAAVLERALSPV
jgi:hypothetical protein